MITGPYNLLMLFGGFAPLFLILFVILASAFNGTIQNGLIYFSGIIVISFFAFLISKMMDNYNIAESKMASLSCNILAAGQKWTTPNLDSTVLAFTFVYLLSPMLANNQMNIEVLVTIGILFSANILFQLKNNCLGNSYILAIVVGLLLGSIGGFLWFIMLFLTKKDLLFFNELLSNNVVCNRPSKQRFRCNVYKNGQLISSSFSQ
jgi:hypothetical protein